MYVETKAVGTFIQLGMTIAIMAQRGGWGNGAASKRSHTKHHQSHKCRKRKDNKHGINLKLIMFWFFMLNDNFAAKASFLSLNSGKTVNVYWGILRLCFQLEVDCQHRIIQFPSNSN